MRAWNGIASCCFILCCLLMMMISGCDNSSNTNGNQNQGKTSQGTRSDPVEPPSKEVSQEVRKAEDALRKAQDALSRAEKEVSESSERFNRYDQQAAVAKTKSDEIKRKIEQKQQNPMGYPTFVAAETERTNAESLAHSEKDRLDAANKRAADAKKDVEKAEEALKNAKAGGPSSSNPVLYIVLVVIIGIGILVWRIRMLKKKPSQGNKPVEPDLSKKASGDKMADSVATDLQEHYRILIKPLVESVSALKEQQEKIITQLELNTSAVKDLNEQIYALINTKNEKLEGAGGSEDHTDSRTLEDGSDDNPFPIPARTYLDLIRKDIETVRTDTYNNMLIKDPKGSLAVIPNHNSPESGYLIPIVAYFQREQDYFNHYTTYYDCEGQEPFLGEITIDTPATVSKITGGWKLKDRGKLKTSG
jgi:hypothetical protein